MPTLRFDNIHIAGLAACVPANIQTLEEDAKIHPEEVKNFLKITGIKQRHISNKFETAVDFGCQAARTALRNAAWERNSIDALIFLSQTPDFNPGTGNAFLAHYILGLQENCMAFDITLGCSAYPFGMSVAASLLQNPDIKRLLLISGDTEWASHPDGKPKAIAGEKFMFGEASVATLLERSSEVKAMTITTWTDGSGYKFLYNPLDGTRNRWTKGDKFILPNGHNYERKIDSRYMDGLEITNFCLGRVPKSIQKFLQENDLTINDFDGVVLHQANQQLVTRIGKKLKVNSERLPMCMDRYGNTNGASAPLAIIDAYGNSKSKDLFLLLSSFGVGLSWGVMCFHIDPSVISPVEICTERFDEGLLCQLEEE